MHRDQQISKRYSQAFKQRTKALLRRYPIYYSSCNEFPYHSRSVLMRRNDNIDTPVFRPSFRCRVVCDRS